MTEAHWKVIDFCRASGETSGKAPTLRAITNGSGCQHQRTVLALFPKGPAKKVARISGLGKPEGCVYHRFRNHERNNKMTDEPRKIAFICSKGNLDMVYPALVMGWAALGNGIEVTIFFTFWGMDMINKERIDHL